MMQAIRLLMVVVLLFASVAAQAIVGCEWETPPPFGTDGWVRDLQWRFNGQDWRTPETHYGPVWDSAPDWTCDEVRVDPELSVSQIGEEIRFENQSTSALELVFHINNYDNCRPLKRMWIELDWDPALNTSLSLRAPSSSSFAVTRWEPVGSKNWYAEIVRNPPHEELVFTVGAGGILYLRDLHVRTECVPEPSSLVALLAGLALLIRRRR